MNGTPCGGMVLRVVRTCSLLLVAAGILALCQLAISDAYAQWAADQSISRLQGLCASGDEDERLSCRTQAHRYNARLAGRRVRGPVLPYKEQLLFRGEPMMAYIEIPRISVRLPIYHGMEENALMAGVGHWPSSSLPVGGKSTHCVLLGHSGMRNARMFDDIRLLEPGDRIVIWTLGDPYAYAVSGIEVIKPEDVEGRTRIRQKQDLVTLVTCTPYGVNTHRLLVHARRCGYQPNPPDTAPAVPTPGNRGLPLLAASALVVAAVIASCAGRIHRKRKARKAGRLEGVSTCKR